MKKKYFRFYPQYMEVLGKLSYRQQNKVLIAIVNYIETETLPDKLNSKSYMIFNAIKPYIDGDIEYQKMCEERRSYGKKGAKKRWTGNSEMAKNSKNMAKK